MMGTKGLCSGLPPCSSHSASGATAAVKYVSTNPTVGFSAHPAHAHVDPNDGREIVGGGIRVLEPARGKIG